MYTIIDQNQYMIIHNQYNHWQGWTTEIKKASKMSLSYARILANTYKERCAGYGPNPKILFVKE